MLYLAIAVALMVYGSATKPRVIFLIEIMPTNFNQLPGLPPVFGATSINAWYEKLRADRDRGVFAYVLFDKNAPVGGAAQSKTATSWPKVNDISHVVDSGLNNETFPSIQDAVQFADTQVEPGGAIMAFCGYKCSPAVCRGNATKTDKTRFAVETEVGKTNWLAIICQPGQPSAVGQMQNASHMDKFQKTFDNVMHPKPRPKKDNPKKSSLSLPVIIAITVAVVVVLIAIIVAAVIFRKKEAPESHPDKPSRAPSRREVNRDTEQAKSLATTYDYSKYRSVSLDSQHFPRSTIRSEFSTKKPGPHSRNVSASRATSRAKHSTARNNEKSGSGKRKGAHRSKSREGALGKKPRTHN